MSKLRAIGTISVSNVESPNKECITLTYSIKDVGSISKAKALRGELDNVTGDESSIGLEVKDAFTSDETWNMSYKIKLCEDEAVARKHKIALDKFLRKKGGQTTLDES